MLNHTATYSPEDNKLRLYPAHKLDPAEYERVKAAGFKWAPKQGLFVAPMWTPAREDLLIDMCGELGDEDTSLVDRAEQRADRFEDYSENRANNAESARKFVSAIADNITFGQPILVGHHSEKHARKDAQRIENGMRRAVKMWEQSEYWKHRAAGALRHAKYKELPAVRHRRIKGLEADKRKQERSKQEAEMWLKLWLECEAEQDAELQKAVALRIAGMCWLHLPRKEGDREDWSHTPTAYDALNGSHPNLYAPRTLAEVIEAAKKTYPATIAHCDRWIAHFDNRIAYERAMLDEQGGLKAEGFDIQPGGRVLVDGEWLLVMRVNKKGGQINSVTTNARYVRVRGIEEIKDYRAPTEEDAAKVKKAAEPVKFEREPVAPAPVAAEQAPANAESIDKRAAMAEDFQAMRDQLKAGVQVVSAPQLFPTPADLAARMVELADIEPGMRVLEPSAGTGRILEQLPEGCEVVAVEINAALGGRLDASRRAVVIGDFLQCTPETLWGSFDRILMNPPFANADDIKHIKHALTMLAPCGRLVAICANGPRQRAELMHLGEWEDLPPGSFAASGTNVNAALLVVQA